MKSKILSCIVLLCIITCTVIVYRLIFEDNVMLFYINVLVTSLAEIILMINIPILSNKRFITFKNATTSIVLDFLAIVLFLWTSISSLFVEDESDYRILYIGLLVISIIFVILFSSVEVGGNFMQKEEKKQQQLTQEKKMSSKFLNTYRMEVLNILSTVNPESSYEISRMLDIILDKVATIPSEKLEHNGSATTSIHERFDDIKIQLEKLREEGIQETQCAQIIQKLESFNNYITMIKSTL